MSERGRTIAETVYEAVELLLRQQSGFAAWRSGTLDQLGRMP